MAKKQKYKTPTNKTPNKTSNKKPLIVLGITLGTISLAGLGYWYFIGRKDATENNETANTTNNTNNEDVPKLPKPNNSTHQVSIPIKDNFPLQLKSKGDKIKQIQNELIKKYGKDILPKFGADGQFGKELETALVSKGFSKIIDADSFAKLLALNSVAPVSPPITEPKKGLSEENSNRIDIAKNLWLNTATKKLNPLLDQLKRIKTVEEYKAVNDLFKTIRLKGIRQTIVNGTLNSFTDATSKQLIRQEFYRIGLKYDGDKWTLSGFFKRQLIAKQNTTIRSNTGAELEIPENTLLGIEVESINGITSFQTITNELLTVPTKHIDYV